MRFTILGTFLDENIFRQVYIYNGVYNPISEWNKLKTWFRDLEALENEEPTYEQILRELKETVNELTLVEQGKLRPWPAKELLDKL